MFTSIFISISIYLYSFKAMISFLYFQFQSNTTEFNLVFSFSVFVIPFPDSEKPGSQHFNIVRWVTSLYEDNWLCYHFLLPPHQWCFPFPWCQGANPGHDTPLWAIVDLLPSPFSTPHPTPPPSPSMDPYFAQPQIVDFGLNCLGRGEKERKREGMGEEEMRKKGRRLRDGKGQRETGRENRKLNATTSAC